ncbi:hypothetical protein ISCGN_006083, partial [Ixodes scapularis]
MDTVRFHIFHRDRFGSRGGGVMVLVSAHLLCRRRSDLEIDSLEAVFVEIKNGRDRFLSQVFTALPLPPPPPDTRDAAYGALGISRDLVSDDRAAYTNVYLMGDLNARVNWTDPVTPVVLDGTSDCLLELVEYAGLILVCLEPTFPSPSGTMSHLDLVFVQNCSLVVEYDVVENLPR